MPLGDESLEAQVDALFERSDAKYFAMMNKVIEEIRMERERPKLDEWLERADQVLKEESLVLDGLKKAVEEGWMTPDEAEENIAAYHHGLCPDVEGRDL